jgi:uncharacterized protein YeaO (DUF488 family)
MTLFTTYLSALRKVNWNPSKIFPNQLRSVKLVYVMRNRGNNEVAPTKEALKRFKSTNDWEGYKKWYMTERLETKEAKDWMNRTAEESLFIDIFLVCYEKDPQRCHRTLLALKIKQLHPEVNYVGELSTF